MCKDLGEITYKQIIFLGLTMLLALLIVGGGGVILGKLFWSDADILAAGNSILDSPERISYMRYMQFITMFATFFLPAVLLALSVKQSAGSFLYINRPLDAKRMILLVALFFILLPLINALMFWNQSLHLPESMAGLEQWMRDKEEQLGMITQKFVGSPALSVYLVNMLVMAVLPAFGEEFIFRAILIKWFNKRMNIHWSIFLSAVIFSAIHMQFLGFFPRFFIGLVLGYVFYWSGTLWASIWLHFLNNGMMVTAYFLLARGYISGDPDTLGSIDNIPVLMVDVLVFFAAMYWFYRNRPKFSL